ncbi:MAG: zinc metalloprotease HtpX [Chloroflexota bacterium]
MNNALKTTFLLALLTGLLVAVGTALGGRGGMLVALMCAVFMNLGAYRFSGNIALTMAGAHEVTSEQAPQLHALVDELAAVARLPMPRLAIIDAEAPNAFATGRDADHAVLAVTTGILDVLNRDELAGVLSHELAHVQNHDILISSIAATIAGPITLVTQMAQWGMMFGGLGGGRDDRHRNPWGAMLGVLLAPIAALLIRTAISRAREYGADASGARLHGNPESLARALEKLERGNAVRPMQVNPATAHMYIVNPLRVMSLAGLFSSHPPIEERIRRLRHMRPVSLD